MEDVDQNFKEWACSLSGCDGGDPSASIWLCGIEWGFAKARGKTDDEYEEDVRQYYMKDLPKEIAQGRYEPSHDYIWSETIPYPFGKSVAKLYMALKGLKVVDYASIEKTCNNPKLFKLNLYPISFRYANDELWGKYNLKAVTGLESREAYRTWCFLNRFPSISRKVQKNNPQLIIGTGITYLIDFFACFAGTEGSENIHVAEIQSNSSANHRPRQYYWSKVNKGQTLLAVIPFFSGAYGLNSDYLIQQLGSQLAKLL